MSAGDLIAALDLPPDAVVDRRVPKTLLAERGAIASGDKRKWPEGIGSLSWKATLKPSTVGIEARDDDELAYGEIAVLELAARPAAQGRRLEEIVHRAIPYPVVLASEVAGVVRLSLAHKRRSKAEAGVFVVEGVIGVGIEADGNPAIVRAFKAAISMSRQRRDDLYVLYQSWIDTAVDLEAAWVTGEFHRSLSSDEAAVRFAALRECQDLDAQIQALRSSAAKEHQISRRVDTNLQLQRLSSRYAEARTKLR